MKKSFVLYTDYIDHINLLSNEEKGMLLDAIFSIASDKQVNENLPPIVKMALSFINSQMERDKTKYDEYLAKQRENGKKGGRPKGKAKPLDDNPNNPVVNLETHSNLNDTVTVTDTVNDTDIISNDINKSGERDYKNYNNPTVTMPLNNFKKAWGKVKWYSTSTEKAWVDVKGWERLPQIIEHLKLWQESDKWKAENGKYMPKSSDFLLEYLEQEPPVKQEYEF